MNIDEKRSEDQDQQHQSSDSSNVKPELTAEWKVHAQLTISRPGVTSKQSEYDDQQPGSAPVRVVYKWRSDDVKAGEDNSTQQTRHTESPSKGQHESFRSTTAGNKPQSDSGFSFTGSNTSRKQTSSGGTRCKSTCSIVLSAVADFLPPNTEIPEETDPLFYNTTASYTVSPEKASEDINASQNFAAGKILALRDAYSQTSDTETKRLDTITFPSVASLSSGEKKDGRKRKPCDIRRTTDSMLPPPIDEGNSYLPSYVTVSPARTHTSSPGLQTGATVPPVAGSLKNEQKKPPRTVHIDVYCTGSDAEDDDGDDEDDSSTHSSENRNELESNSTPQTVLDNEQMLLRHQRAGKNELPRRFAAAQQTATPQQTTLPNIGHAVTKSSTAEEISESKQILFKKHMGDRTRYNFRNRIVRKDPSDDCISSNYPNSSRSTMRDMTCSSISSAVQSNIYEDIETSWKETEPDLTASIAKSDSFEYDNSIDRLRIKKMEQLWSRPEKEQSEYEEYKSSPSDSPTKSNQQARIQEFLQSYRIPGGLMRQYLDTLHSEYDVLSETDHSFVFDNATIPERDEPPEIQTSYSMPSTSQFDFSRSISTARSPERPTRSLYMMGCNVKEGSEASTMQSNLSGYTSEYLAKARKFGTVVTALRKPGHHVGPAKNPECQCEHCRRWVTERTEGRGRAFSLGDTPTTRGGFWLKRAGLN